MTASVGSPDRGDRYKWIALSNTSLGIFMALLDASIVIIAMPAIFRGIGLDPLAPGNIGYLLWMIMGYLLVNAVLVVSVGRLGDMYGRVRIYNLGFVVFTAASISLSVDPAHGQAAALWLIIWRLVQATGGSMLMANSAAILTDAFPAEQRGMALGINQVSGLAGQFLGLVLGGLLAAWDWRAVFWVNVPFGIFGTVWAYTRLRETSTRHGGRIDWWGNITFAAGLSLLLIGVTYGIQPYRHETMGWTNPKVEGALVLGVVLLVIFGVIETRVPDPMFHLRLFRIRAFTAGSLTALLSSVARGGMQFMLIIWLQGIWLPLHGYDFSDTPLWAGIFLLPLTGGFLVAGPISGYLSDRFGVRTFATAGMALFSVSFVGLILLPVDFPYWAFALLVWLNGVGSGMYAAPNTAAIMSSVPPSRRGSAAGMRATFQNAGMAISIGLFFSLLIAGLHSRLPGTLRSGLTAHGVPGPVANHVASLPPVSTVFAAFLGYNPIQTLLAPYGVLDRLAKPDVDTLTGRQFFPHLISAAFHHGLIVVFTAAAVMGLIAAVVSLMRGGRYYHDENETDSAESPVDETVVPTAAGRIEST
jgi:MFS family permease